MTLRVPPRMATWLLQRLGPSYGNESLAGDLYEEYQSNRTTSWYWKQVLTAICIGWRAHACKLGRHLDAIRRSARLQSLVTSTVLRFSIEALAILGVIALATQRESGCTWERMSDIGWIVTAVGGMGLCVSLGLYLSLFRPASRRAPPIRRNTPLKRLLGVFAVTALSAGTLTWAGGTAHTPHQCTQIQNNVSNK